MLTAVRLVALVAALAAVAAPAHAEPARVELVADGVPAWQARTVATALAAHLDDPHYHAVVIRGALAPDHLTWTLAIGDAVVKHGETALAGMDVRRVAGALASELGRVLVPGGGTVRDVVELPARVGTAAPTAALGLAAVIVFLAIPFLRRGRPRGRALRRTALVALALAAVAAALVAGDAYEWGWVLYAAGGLAWGGFVAVLIPLAFPALPGLDRVEHAELVGALARWAVLAALRTIAVAAAFAPFCAALLVGAAALDVPPQVTGAVLVPAWGLCVRLWWQAWVARVAEDLDRRLVDGDATEANPWHGAVRGYLAGYLRRAGRASDERLAEGVRFLPGTGPDVVTYGGGLTPTRVVVPRPLLELALAPYGRPHDYAAPRVSTLHWTLWNAGLVVPTEVGEVMSTREQRQPRTLAVEGDADPLVFGEPATFAGIVEPSAIDERPPYRPHEDSLWLDYDAGDEHDGTDAGDKDFLFGILAHELGVARRHEDRLATLALALSARLARRPRIAARLARWRRALARPSEALADVHLALSGARDHFVQYLGWQIWRRDDLLTARAFSPELARQTRALAALAAEAPAPTPAPDAPGAEPRADAAPAEAPADAAAPPPTAADAGWGVDTSAPDLRAHLGRLARGPTGTRRARRWRTAALAAACLAAAAAVALAVVRAIDYHATYQARLVENAHGQGK